MNSPSHRLAGAEDAEFNWFYTSSYNYLRSYLYMSFPDAREHAEDVAQDAFFVVYRNFTEILPGSRQAYLFTVARHRMLDVLRLAEHNRRWGSVDDLDDDVLERSASALSLESAFEERDELRGVLEALPQRQREVLYLNLEGFTAEETARILLISRESVRSNLRHARERLARMRASDQGGVEEREPGG